MFKSRSSNPLNDDTPGADTHNDSLFNLYSNSDSASSLWHYPIRYLNRFLPFNTHNKTNKCSKIIGTEEKINVATECQATIADPSKTSSTNFGSINTLIQKVSNQSFKRLTQTSITSQSLLFEMMDACQQFTTAAITNSPATLMANQIQLYQQQMQLLQNSLMTAIGAEKEPLIQPEKGDKRFNDKAWSDRVFFDYIKQSYLLSSNSILDTVEATEGIDNKTRQRLSFFTRQWLNAIAPSNFLLTNPEVLRITKETKGKNLLRGLKQLAEDLEKSAHLLTIRMTDDNAFILGENIAATPGKVVYRNRMFELIQYTPTTELVNKRPFLIVPPWINKFYIVDLKQEKSYIRWALNEGHSVFIISWINPDQSYKQAGMETYMHEGLLTALTTIEKITGEPDANVIGYCIGGMLLALTLSWLAENNQSQRIASATFWTTMFDFSDPGDLGVFIDENIVKALEQEGEKKGVFDGRLMGIAFSLLRENSLYWNYYIQNYLKGERPTPFDLLYWNSDCTNVTAALHRFVLRELYLGNKLIQKGVLQFDNINIDLSKVTTPTYVVAALQDHIVKWKGSYQSTQVLGGDVTFVLAESGHVAGIINPPTGKYGFYTHHVNVSDPDQWFELAQKQDRSWWLHWGEWISNYSSDKVPARQPGMDNHGNEWSVLCDAPGEYVRIKAAEALA
ncbi:class I poly(R)-hydroxyalkanoic acid synthase [Psychrobacter sanguinis]|uniref:class I poly(R)-hydroxyalkanoic acid synthase n=1 Tax=Psychrobacter sanguinis TaxID=861445 RepID=UPI000E905C3E|nr:class I poly(R)-hydroxyalkanoic acid synthase [Psychrobacter sanguinis]HBH34653.1 class I poly(R)-hydroxyalkanoic acid synthase [Psychrobacter sp.]